MTQDQFDDLVDNATHAVNDLMPSSLMNLMGDNERTRFLHSINDALTAILTDAIVAYQPLDDDPDDILRTILGTDTFTGNPARYEVIVTRGATESCVMVVEAGSIAAAHKHALERAKTDTDLVWTLDEDTPGANSEIDVTHCEEID